MISGFRDLNSEILVNALRLEGVESFKRKKNSNFFFSSACLSHFSRTIAGTRLDENR